MLILYYISRSLILVVATVGILGNILSFVVFTRSTFKNNSIATYCRALAISDFYIILIYINSISILAYGDYFTNQSSIGCKVFYLFNVSLSSIPGWILAAFSVDKLLNMRRPQMTLHKKKWFQWTVVTVIFVYNLLINLEVPFLLDLKPTNQSSNEPLIDTCTVSNMKYFNIFSIIMTLNLTIIPFVIMIVTSVLIITTLRSSRRRLETVDANGRDQRKAREVKFAVSSLTFNILFIVLRLPLVISYFLAGYNIKVNVYYNEIALLLYYGNSSATMLIHFVSNSIFRSETVKFFRRQADYQFTSDMISSIKKV